MGCGPCTPQPIQRVHVVYGLQRNHRSRGQNGPKLEYITRPINVILEQSFPARNSIRKVDCCVIVVAERSFGGVVSKPDISGRYGQNCDDAA